MAKNAVVELDRLKSEALDYLRTNGAPIFFAAGIPGEDGFYFWDAEQYPDWRQFVDVGRESGARLFQFSSEALDRDEIDGANETLELTEMPAEERRDAQAFLVMIEPNIGHTAWLRIAWQHEGRRYAYERVAPWYERFLDLLDQLGDYMPDIDGIDEGEGGGDPGEPNDRGGFYSLN